MPKSVIWIIVLVVLAGFWLVSRAQRVDHLHRQVAAARVVLFRHLSVRRAMLRDMLDDVYALDNDAGDELSLLLATPDPDEDGHTPASESAITIWLSDVLLAKYGDQIGRTARAIRTNGFEVQAARRFYNQQVGQVQRLRSRSDVVLFHLAGKAQMPQTIDFEDELK